MSVECDGCADVYTEKRVKARKAHVCGACRQTIEPGHRYVSASSLYDGSWSMWKRCLRCDAIYQHLLAKSERRREWDWMPAPLLDCGETYEDEWGECPPEIAALAFKTGADMQDGAQ